MFEFMLMCCVCVRVCAFVVFSVHIPLPISLPYSLPPSICSSLLLSNRFPISTRSGLTLRRAPSQTCPMPGCLVPLMQDPKTKTNHCVNSTNCGFGSSVSAGPASQSPAEKASPARSLVSSASVDPFLSPFIPCQTQILHIPLLTRAMQWFVDWDIGVEHKHRQEYPSS